MNPSDPHSAHETHPRRSGFWQKLGGGSLSISLFVHLVIVIIGLFWIFRIIPPQEKKDPDFGWNSGGGGPVGKATQQKHQVQLAKSNLARISAKNVVSNVVLPETEPSSQLVSTGTLGNSGLGGGLGGNGDGGGRGRGHGPGIGDGFLQGNSHGTLTKTPFGTADTGMNALAGTFYDLKQTADGKPTNMSDDEMRKELPEIVRRGFKDTVLKKYFKAPTKLYQSKWWIPIMSADGAPAAFEVEKVVQPRRWVVAYRGSVQAPHAGRYRFVGVCDDILVIRFNNRPVFDYGYTVAGLGFHANGRAEELDGTKPNAELQHEVRRNTPMSSPIKFYKYANTPGHNQRVGGFAIGPEFEARANTNYPIEILIGEIPGGFFSVNLMIEEIGVNYEKDPMGSPILPLFKLDESEPQKGDECPPVDLHGPVWKFVSTTAADDF